MARRRRGLPEVGQRQVWLDEFRSEYNHLRRHEALEMRTPASVWRASERRYQPDPPEWEYGREAEVHRLNAQGQLLRAGWRWPISQALRQRRVEVKRVRAHSLLVYCCQSLVRAIDLIAQRSTAVDRWAQPANCKDCKGCGDNAV